VAATCIVDEDCDRVFLPDKLWRISLNLDNCNPYYFKFLLSQNELRSNLTKTATGTSGSMLNISMDKLRRFVLPIAPIELQNKFAIIFDKVEAQKKLAQAALRDTESTFNSLLSSYFKS
jgi:type I restriction enzyme S subunit